MGRFIVFLESISTWCGERIKWLTTALVILIFTDVLLRYLFAHTRVWIIELEWHLFALIFLIGAAHTLKVDQHVRVDVFYANWSARKKALVDLMGTLVFLIPWCLVVIYTGFDYAGNSLAIGESSPDPGGLPARYVIKFAIPIGFVLLLLQAVAVLLRSVRTLLAKSRS